MRSSKKIHLVVGKLKNTFFNQFDFGAESKRLEVLLWFFRWSFWEVFREYVPKIDPSIYSTLSIFIEIVRFFVGNYLNWKWWIFRTKLLTDNMWVINIDNPSVNFIMWCYWKQWSIFTSLDIILSLAICVYWISFKS